MKSIGVILTVFNRKQKTLFCLEKLYESFNYFNKNNEYKLNIYLTDDGSTDGTSKAVKKKFSNVIVLNGNGQLYWNRGMLKSWSLASKNKYDFYLWVNDDTFIVKESFILLFKDSIKLAHKAIICGATQSKDTGKVTYGGRTKKSNLLVPNGEVQKCYFINGNFVLIPKVIYESIGMLNPFYHHGLGDFDYGIRAQKAGFNCYTSSNFIGYCEKNGLNRCFNPKINLKTRLKVLYSPLGINPQKQFYYDKNNANIFKAIKNFITIHTRTILPTLWTLKHN